MSTHTKGPWTIVKRNAERQVDTRGKSISVDTLEGITIAELGAGVDNAHLIAAAPELLELLKDIEEILNFEEHPAIIATIKKMIAKAEGSEK